MSDYERSQKIIDRIIKFSKHCGRCKHMHLSHIEGGHCIAANGTNGEQLVMCKCKEYIPEDNLDFIEWLAQKKGIIK